MSKAKPHKIKSRRRGSSAVVPTSLSIVSDAMLLECTPLGTDQFEHDLQLIQAKLADIRRAHEAARKEAP